MSFASRLEWLKPEGRLKSEYFGIVIDNNDPETRGRIKVWVPEVFELSELQDLVQTRDLKDIVKSKHLIRESMDHIPWCIPMGTGYGLSNQSVDVPLLFTPVVVKFPYDDLYHPSYELFSYNEINPITVLGSEYPDTVGKTISSVEDILNWVKYNRKTGRLELFLGDNRLMVDFSEANHLRLYVDGDVTTSISGNLETKIGGSKFLKVAGSLMTKVIKNIGFGSKNFGILASSEFGVQSSSQKLKAGEIKLEGKGGCSGDWGVGGSVGAGGDIIAGGEIGSKGDCKVGGKIHNVPPSHQSPVPPSSGPSVPSGATSVLPSTSSSVASANESVDAKAEELKAKVDELEALAKQATEHAKSIRKQLEELIK